MPLPPRRTLLSRTSSLSGNYIEQATGSTFGTPACNSGNNCSNVTLGVIGLLTGNVTASNVLNYSAGAAPASTPLSGTYTIDSSGRLAFTNPFTPVLYVAVPQPNTEQISAFVIGTDDGASFGTFVPGANSSVSTASLAGNRIVGNVDPGDFTVQDIAGVGQIAANGNVTGYQYDSDFTGLSENTIGGNTPPVVTITNSPALGWGGVGGTSIGVTDGTRIWFFDPGAGNTSPASITVLEP